MNSKVDRRAFLSVLGAMSVVPSAAHLLDAQGPAPPQNPRILRDQPPTSTSPQRPVLQQSDFKLLGHYDIQTPGGNAVYAQGLTYRYVNGDFRLLNWQLGDRLDEISLAGKPFGSRIDTPTRSWSKIGGLFNFHGLWWDEAASRLWSVSAIDYVADAVPVQIYTRRLNDDGTVTDVRGPISLTGISAKRVYGGVQPVPAWFQRDYGTGPYVVGWGGYTSLVAQGGTASLGPTMYAVPDPQGYAPGSQIPTTAFRTIMDCASGTTEVDWYRTTGAKTPSRFDRGVRVSPVTNFFDGNDTSYPRPQNGLVKPTGAPVPGNWQSPAPDGLGRWVWGDSYYGTGCWIDGPNKQGFVLIASLGGGIAWYGGSNMHYDSREYEFHVYDPSHFGEVLKGSRPVWNVKPAHLWAERFEGYGKFALDGNVPVGNIAAATYDPMTKRLYALGFGAPAYSNRLFVYEVNA